MDVKLDAALNNECFGESTEESSAKPLPLEGTTAEITEKATDQALPEKPSDERPSDEKTPADVPFAHDDLRVKIDAILKEQKDNGQKLLLIHKEYHNGFANVISNMQRELDEYRKGIKKELLKPVLKFLAELYSENEDIIYLEQGEKRDSRINDLFQDILDYLEQFDVTSHVSEKGEVYSKRFCKIVGKIESTDANAQGTVAESRCRGFHMDKEVLVAERIKIFVNTVTDAPNQQVE